MDLEQRLGPYEVTSVPGGIRLRLVWSVPADAADEPAEERPEGDLAILADYRATRAPVATRAAG